jgi:hypothetical protein
MCFSNVLFVALISRGAVECGAKACILFLPAVEGLFGDAHFSGDLGHGRYVLGLLEDKGESFPR